MSQKTIASTVQSSIFTHRRRQTQTDRQTHTHKLRHTHTNAQRCRQTDTKADRQTPGPVWHISRLTNYDSLWKPDSQNWVRIYNIGAWWRPSQACWLVCSPASKWHTWPAETLLASTLQNTSSAWRQQHQKVLEGIRNVLLMEKAASCCRTSRGLVPTAEPMIEKACHEQWATSGFSLWSRERGTLQCESQWSAQSLAGLK